MRTLCLILTTLCLLSATAPAETEGDFSRRIGLFRAAQRQWDGPQMEAVRRQFAEAASAAPGDYRRLYWLGVSEFYLMLYYGLEESAGHDPVRAAELREAAAATLQAAIDVRPEEAECHAMLSSVYGFRIVAHPLAAVWEGPKLISLQKRALKNGRDNPRVHYIIGAGYLRAPGFFRSLRKARRMLERAYQLFRAEAAAVRPPDAPIWGFVECCGLLGDLERQAGDFSTARKYYQQALRENPGYTPAVRELEEMQDEYRK